MCRIHRSNLARKSDPVVVFSKALVFALCFGDSAFALTTNRFVSEKRSEGSFRLFAETNAASIFVDPNDWPGVARVAQDLQKDIGLVSKTTPALAHEPAGLGENAILVGTIGRSAIIDQLVSERKIDVTDIAGKWEASLIQVVSQPLPGVESARTSFRSSSVPARHTSGIR